MHICTNILATNDSASELLRQMATTDIAENVRRDVIFNCRHLLSKMLQNLIPHLLSPLPYEYLLTNNSPCNYARVQEEVFRLLAKQGHITLLAKAENQPKYIYDTSSEILFKAIRRDKIREMEPFVSTFIERRIGDDQVHVRRMVVEAAWVLADLGNTKIAQEVINQIAETIDLSVSGDDWILGDILNGINLLSPDYALGQIEKVWSKIETSNSVLIPTQCIEALEHIGTQKALDMLERIAQDTVGQPNHILEPERALRAIQMVSSVGREDWLIDFLKQNHQDRHIVLRVIDMLGMTGNRKVIPFLKPYCEDYPNERIRYVAFWAIHNIYKAMNEVWYNAEEVKCV